MEMATSRYDKDEETFALLLIDLDNFKLVNDKFGHDVGDDVLKHFSQVCSNVIRNIDTFGRYGGEEFLILLENADLNAIELLFHRLRKAFNDNKPVSLPLSHLLTFSMGAAFYHGQNDKTLTELIGHADKRLYDAKRQGRDQFVV